MSQERRSYRLYPSDIALLRVKANNARGTTSELWRICQTYEKHRAYFEDRFGLFESRKVRPPATFARKSNKSVPTSFQKGPLTDWLDNLMEDEKLVMYNYQPFPLLVHLVIQAVEFFDNHQEEVAEWHEENRPQGML